ncbi:tumor necrosis factor receptor superfamily member 4 [Myripristis murdjan]|uniref:tumor necrosis factor receptor superfamily member 4 n=1 Tax=Myripristis murdjan TaxID=586833 RepID=UPI001175E69A|nr:tumor necrosis factor receptor superfamily member 4-like [Myripristis murdjan]XP_029908120.1 tumor necrosis factor receptor superfamily member 4-like [Myripristis murdjan]
MVLLARKVVFLLILIFILSPILDASVRCPEGHRVSRGQNKCESCPHDQYQDEENLTNNCRPCTRCNPERGSEEELRCLKTRDTKCRCRQGFIPFAKDFTICKCNRGFGLIKKGNIPECRECEDGFFNKDVSDLPCRKWAECKTGVKVNGTKTSDVICNVKSSSSSPVMVPTTTNKRDTLSTHYTSRPPNVNKPSQVSPPTSSTTSTPLLSVITKTTRRPFTPTTDNSGMSVLFAFGIVGLLILVTVTCKLNIIPCIQSYKKQKGRRSELVSRPVEESGDSSNSSLVKLNPVDP